MSIGLRVTTKGSVPMQTKCMESYHRQGARTSREYKFVPLQYRSDVSTRGIHHRSSSFRSQYSPQLDATHPLLDQFMIHPPFGTQLIKIV